MGNIIGFLLSDQDLEDQCWSASDWGPTSSAADILDPLVPWLTLRFAPRKFHCPCCRSPRSALSFLWKRGGRSGFPQSVPSLPRLPSQTELDIIWVDCEIARGKVEKSSRWSPLRELAALGLEPGPLRPPGIQATSGRPASAQSAGPILDGCLSPKTAQQKIGKNQVRPASMQSS